MTENQLYPMSADFFDSPSNSSNPLKYDLYAPGLSNSNSNSGLYSLGSQHGLSPTPSSHTPIGAMSPISPTSIPSTTAANSPVTFENIRDNPMLTNAILIPRNSNNNSNQTMHHHQRLIADLSEYGLDALDASSLSPTLLQVVSLSASSPINSSGLNITPNGNDGYYHQTSPTLSNSSELTVATLNGDIIAATVAATTGAQSCPNDSGLGSTDGGGSHNASHTSNVGHTNETLFGSTTTSHHHEHHIIPNPNAMWSDIGSAIVSMKNEPSFNMDEDYIFPNDKSEIQATNFTDINDETFLEVIGSIEEFIPNSDHSGLFLSPTSSASGESGRSGCGSLQQLHSPQTSPVGPPQQLLQQQQHQQHQQHSSQQQQNHLLRCQLNQQSHQVQILQPSSQQAHNPNNSYDERHLSRHHHHHHHHVSSSPYEIYHSTPNKQQQQQHQNTSASTFSPGSHNSSQSPLLFNSITPPPPTPSLHIGHRSPYHSNLLKSRNVHDLLKREFSMSPDRNNGGQNVSARSHMILSGIALSPSSGSSGFGSTIGGSNGGGVGSGNGNGNGNGHTCGVGVRRPFSYQNDTTVSRLSSSAPTQTGLEQIWLRREPRQHLLSTGSLAEAESFSSISTRSVLSPDAIDFSQDDEEEASTDYNSDHFDDFSSDNATSDNETNNCNESLSQLSSTKSKERFFWQYNVQAKGPKGKRLVFQSKLEDPHVLNEVTDPVFSPNCSVRGIKHSGKARKGDGNDLTPNPKKLHSIGKELDKLSRTINDMIPVSELPFNVRPKSRKEKNKLASRACRLKKKAQHEANKIKLHGLEIEHRKLLSGISEVKQLLALKYQNQSCVDANLREEFDQQIERIYVNSTDVRIAGETADFVNQVLDNIKSGMNNGGLEELRKSS